MLLSMTGFGEAQLQQGELSISVEIRAVNNRYLKLSYRANEPYHLLEAQVEKLIRQTVRRGTIQMNVRVRRQASLSDFPINAIALESYIRQVQDVTEKLSLGSASDSLLSQVLMLPGVIEESATRSSQVEEHWPIMEQTIQQALDRLQTMRRDEGQAMSEELLALRNFIGEQLEQIRERAPLVVEGFRDRLFERVRSLLQEMDVELDQNTLIREVSIFAERSDIAEEIVRLASHLEQFGDILKEKDSVGRKLEFLSQEMTRETSTIGSKASDIPISRHVVEIKGAIEKIRELVQNIE